MNPIRNLQAMFGGALIVAGVSSVVPVISPQAAGSNEVIETVIAPATEQNPRNSEGDVLARKDGSLLAVWSDYYKGGAADHAPARISASESKDKGRTWSERNTLQETIGRQNVMSASLVRLKNSDVLFFFLVKNSPKDLHVYLRRSFDDGRTFSAPIQVTRVAGYHVMNNARPIQLRGGRVLCPTAWVPRSDVKDGSYRALISYSDDEGHTWQQSPNEISLPQRGAMEPGLVQLKNGEVCMILRTQFGEIWHARSKDDGLTWGQPESFHVSSPESPATIARLPGDDGSLLLVRNPLVDPKSSHGGRRTPLVATLSRDNGQTWGAPYELEGDLTKSYAYTSITFQDQRTLFTYYVEDSPGRFSWKFKSVPVERLK